MDYYILYVCSHILYRGILAHLLLGEGRDQPHAAAGNVPEPDVVAVEPAPVDEEQAVGNIPDILHDRRVHAEAQRVPVLQEQVRPQHVAQDVNHLVQQLVGVAVDDVLADVLPDLVRLGFKVGIGEGLLGVEALDQKIGNVGRNLDVLLVDDGGENVVLAVGDRVLHAHDGVHEGCHGRDDFGSSDS